MSGGAVAGPAGRVRIKGRSASVIRFFLIAIAFMLPWVLLTSELGWYAQLYGPQVLLQLNLAFYLPSIPILVISSHLERALDARFGPTYSMALRLNSGLIGCLAMCVAFPFLPHTLLSLMAVVVVLGTLSAVAFSTAYQLVSWFRAADTISLGIGGAGSGPLVLIIQLVLAVGPRPEKWQWIAMFEIAAAFVAAGLFSSVSLFTQYWGILSGSETLPRSGSSRRRMGDEGAPLLPGPGSFQGDEETGDRHGSGSGRRLGYASGSGSGGRGRVLWGDSSGSRRSNRVHDSSVGRGGARLPFGLGSPDAGGGQQGTLGDIPLKGDDWSDGEGDTHSVHSDGLLSPMPHTHHALFALAPDPFQGMHMPFTGDLQHSDDWGDNSAPLLTPSSGSGGLHRHSSHGNSNALKTRSRSFGREVQWGPVVNPMTYKPPTTHQLTFDTGSDARGAGGVGGDHSSGSNHEAAHAPLRAGHGGRDTASVKRQPQQHISGQGRRQHLLLQSPRPGEQAATGDFAFTERPPPSLPTPAAIGSVLLADKRRGGGGGGSGGAAGASTGSSCMLGSEEDSDSGLHVIVPLQTGTGRGSAPTTVSDSAVSETTAIWAAASAGPGITAPFNSHSPFEGLQSAELPAPKAASDPGQLPNLGPLQLNGGIAPSEEAGAVSAIPAASDVAPADTAANIKPRPSMLEVPGVNSELLSTVVALEEAPTAAAAAAAGADLDTAATAPAAADHHLFVTPPKADMLGQEEVEAMRPLTLKEETQVVVGDIWQVQLGFFCSVTLLYLVFPFFTYIPSSGWLAESLPRVLFFVRIFADLVGRFLPRRKAWLTSSPQLLLGLATFQTVAVVLLFIYMKAPPRLLSDALTVTIIAVVWCIAGYLNTACNLLAPSVTHPSLRARAGALMALTFQVGHFAGLVLAAALAAVLFGNILGH